MHNVQLMKKKYIYSVYKNNSKKKNWFTCHETHVFLNNHCQECVRGYLSIHCKSVCMFIVLAIIVETD
jgi:hypothetical protein